MMNLWKRNAVVAAIVLFVCAAVYLNWSYSQTGEATGAPGKTLGEATLVGTDAENGAETDPLLPPGGGKETLSEDYFATARLNRQQARDSALTLLQKTTTDVGAEQVVKDTANVAIQTMADSTVTEAQIENLIIAKGYGDCIAFMSDDSISIVVSAKEGGITTGDTAKITDIIVGETTFTTDQIKIIEAVG